jgi:hypothetical protein
LPSRNIVGRLKHGRHADETSAAATSTGPRKYASRQIVALQSFAAETAAISRTDHSIGTPCALFDPAGCVVSIGDGPALEFDCMAWFTKSRKQKRRGVLTLEWVLLVTVIIIGIIGGLGAVRNATNGELLDLAEAITSLNVKTAAEAEAEAEMP